jgi:hypothetical protein
MRAVFAVPTVGYDGGRRDVAGSGGMMIAMLLAVLGVPPTDEPVSGRRDARPDRRRLPAGSVSAGGGMGCGARGVALVGEIPPGLPEFVAPNLPWWRGWCRRRRGSR